MGLLTDRNMELNDRYALMSLNRLATQGNITDGVGIHIYTNENPLYDRLREGLANIIMDYPRMQDLFMEVFRSRTMIKCKFTDRMVRFDGRNRNSSISISELGLPSGGFYMLNTRSRFTDQTMPVRLSSFRVQLIRANDMVDMMYNICDFLADLGILTGGSDYGRPFDFSMLIHHYFYLRAHEKNECGMDFAMNLIGSVNEPAEGRIDKVIWSTSFKGE